MNNLLDQPLSQIVLENFQTAYVLENNGLDFCCKGKQTLRTACNEKGIEPDNIIDQLNLAFLKPDHSEHLENLSLSTLADYIVEIHHTYVKRNLPLIAAHLLKIATKHSDRFPHMKKVFVLFTQLKTELEFHIEKEETVLFPMIKQLEQEGFSKDSDYLENPIKIMEDEHETAGTLMQKIRELTNNYEGTSGACTTFQLTMNALHAFESDLHRHVHLENNILFRKALNLMATQY